MFEWLSERFFRVWPEIGRKFFETYFRVGLILDTDFRSFTGAALAPLRKTSQDGDSQQATKLTAPSRIMGKPCVKADKLDSPYCEEAVLDVWSSGGVSLLRMNLRCSAPTQASP